MALYVYGCGYVRMPGHKTPKMSLYHEKKMRQDAYCHGLSLKKSILKYCIVNCITFSGDTIQL